MTKLRNNSIGYEDAAQKLNMGIRFAINRNVTKQNNQPFKIKHRLL